MLDVNEQWRFGDMLVFLGSQAGGSLGVKETRMAYGIVHFFAGGTKSRTTHHWRRYIPAEPGCRKGKPFTPLARRLVAGRCLRSTSPRRVGSASVMTS